MAGQEIKSLASQLAYTYSANRRSTRPFSNVLFTSLNARTLDRMESTNDASYKRWTGTEWWQESYERLWSGTGEGDTKGGPEGSKLEQGGSQTSKESVIYLTADSEQELLELKEDETYIIGGICDHNRYKVGPFRSQELDSRLIGGYRIFA